jgi:hypothetical protein
MQTFYTIYKITNLITNKIYIGQHKTTNINDEYYGSGKILNSSIKKYGKDNFKKEILFIFDNKEDMNLKESEIVNKEFVNREDTYNLKTGGYGGWDHINNGSSEHIQRCKNASKKRKIHAPGKKFMKNDARTRELSIKGNLAKSILPYKESTRKKISDYQKNNNSMKDKCWIELNSIRKVISVLDIEKYKTEGWIICKEKVKEGNKLWINNGIKSIIINRNLLEEYINNGWKIGRLFPYKSSPS